MYYLCIYVHIYIYIYIYRERERGFQGFGVEGLGRVDVSGLMIYLSWFSVLGLVTRTATEMRPPDSSCAPSGRPSYLARKSGREIDT